MADKINYDVLISEVDEKITKTKERIEKLTKSLAKAKKDVVNLENKKKALMYDNEHKEV